MICISKCYIPSGNISFSLTIILNIYLDYLRIFIDVMFPLVSTKFKETYNVIIWIGKENWQKKIGLSIL